LHFKKDWISTEPLTAMWGVLCKALYLRGCHLIGWREYWCSWPGCPYFMVEINTFLGQVVAFLPSGGWAHPLPPSALAEPWMKWR
jgi:hypothetical protein